jgi:hypothetical protein
MLNVAPGAAAFIYLIPLGRLSGLINLEPYGGDLGALLRPMTTGSGFSWRHSVDGFVSYAADSGNSWYSYSQVLRNGTIEAFTTAFTFQAGGDVHRYLDGKGMLAALREYVPAFLRCLREPLGVEPPYGLFLSLHNVRGVEMASQAPGIGNAIERDTIVPPPLLIDDPASVTIESMLPLLDVFWQATGRHGVPRPVT